MDNKFYVSLEAARLLKEKGYNEEVESFYNTLGELVNVSNLFCCEVADNTKMAKYDYLSAPTKAEAIDWLDSKGVIIEVLQDYRGVWFYVIKISETESYVSESDNNYFPTRLEAEDVAVIKALEFFYDLQ